MKKSIILSMCLTLGMSLTSPVMAQTTKGSGTTTYAKKLSDVKVLLSEMTLEEKISQLTNTSKGIDRLGIKPYNWWSEALHGVARNGRATVFPQPIGLGATFDPELTQSIGDAIADEARAKYNAAQKIGNYAQYAGLTFWSPNVNIFRDVRWGRGMETFGEDPYLTGRMGTAFVLGLQGNDPFYLKAAACAKHYAVHSGPEGTRHSANVKPTRHDLFETYLPAFKQLVQEGHVESVMGAYNRVYDESASGSQFLLKDILRNKWGFNGHVVSDCGAVTDICNGHHIARSEAEACAIAIKNGLNVECGNSMEHIGEALEQGLITEADIDEALIPLFMTRMKLGILYRDDACPYNNIPSSVITSDKNANIALKAAEESMVLLKNNGILPLDRNEKDMYIYGPAATDIFTMMGNYYGLSNRYTSYLEGIMNKVGDGTTINYKQGFLISSPSNSLGSWSYGEVLTSKISIIFVGNTGNTEGEEGDAISSPSTGDRNSLALPESQMEVIRSIIKDKSPDNRIVTVITGGSPVQMKEILEMSDAVVYAWYPGQEGGKALGNLLFGDASFSGRLPITFPTSLDNLPSLDDYSMKGRTYKYQTKDIEFPFGYGLTYSNVEYSAAKVLPASGKKINGKQNIKVACTLTNKGTRDIVEVAQLYLSAPGAGESTPIASLIDFKRQPLKAGQSTTVEFTITPDQLKTFQEDGTEKLLRGNYTLTIGGAAPGTRSQELGVSSAKAEFKL